MPPFEIGDRVICINSYDGNEEIVGVSGTVCGPVNPTWCGVMYDIELSRGHDCRGHCPKPFGWETAHSCLMPLDESSSQTESPITMSYEELLDI